MRKKVITIMSVQPTSLIIKSSKTGPTKEATGGHVVRIRLEGTEPPAHPISRPDGQSCVYISSETPRESPSSPGQRSAAGKARKLATVYLQPDLDSALSFSKPDIDPSSHSNSNSHFSTYSDKKSSDFTMLIKPEEFFYCERTGGSSTSEAADSGTCSDLDNTTPPPDHRIPSDEDISSDSLSDQESNISQYSSSKLQDDYLVFHLNEKDFDESPPTILDGETFAGRRSFEGESATIRSSRGTIRGVKNRVRAGIATFLSINATKTWQEREAGKVVVYTTTMGIVRDTFQRCLKVRHILRTNLVKYTEKDVFMSKEVQSELRDRMGMSYVNLPQVFMEGLHIGDADTIEKLNESGELRKMLKPYRSMDACTTCQVCGGYRLLPCNVCNGSKKSVHRNQFSTELVALKCMHCDEVGLIKCHAC